MDLFGADIEEDIEDRDEEEGDAVSAPAGDAFVHPRSMVFCEGHGSIERGLLDSYNSGRMPHAVIFSGPKGIGKATMAYRFARFLLKQGIKDTAQGGMFGDAPEPQSLDVAANDPVFRRVASGGHGDLFSTEKKFDEDKGKFKDSLDVEEIRKIPPFLRMTSSEAGWRVVILDDADSMTRNAQNALLKILEEPPKNALLILVAHRAGGLIPTIRSRARMIGFSPLSNETIGELLRRHNPGLLRADIEKLTSIAEGSFGQALHFLDNNALEILGQISGLIESMRWTDIHKLAEQLSGAGSDSAYKSFQEIFIWMVRQSAVARARGAEAVSFIPDDFLKNSSLEETLKICENLEEHFRRADFANLDRRQAVLGAFSLIG
ncbi:MAG: DNA polymerase III subunit delta' [Alphaproteobacteria bacterium]